MVNHRSKWAMDFHRYHQRRSGGFYIVTEEAWMISGVCLTKGTMGHPEIIQVVGDFGESNGLKNFEPFG